jgi:hypothetical protein
VTLYLNVEIKRFFFFAPTALMRAGMPALPATASALNCELSYRPKS